MYASNPSMQTQQRHVILWLLFERSPEINKKLNKQINTIKNELNNKNGLEVEEQTNNR